MPIRIYCYRRLLPDPVIASNLNLRSFHSSHQPLIFNAHAKSISTTTPLSASSHNNSNRCCLLFKRFRRRLRRNSMPEFRIFHTLQEHGRVCTFSTCHLLIARKMWGGWLNVCRYWCCWFFFLCRSLWAYKDYAQRRTITNNSSDFPADSF